MDKSSRTKICRATSISILILLGFLSLPAISCLSYGQAVYPTAYIDPATYHATSLDETFQVNVKLTDVTSDLRIIGAEFKLQYDETLLETHEDWFAEGDFFASIGETYAQTFIFTDDQGKKYIHAFVMLLPSDVGVYSDFPDGEGTLATISFKASTRPVEPEKGSCKLKLYDIIIVDEDLNTVTSKIRSGLYYVDSLPRPTLEVSPKNYTAMRNGETFEIKIDIKDVDPDWHLFGLQFKLKYNTTLIETNPQWISEGSFFNAYGSTWFQATVEDDYVLVGLLILPSGTGGFPGPYPEGEGTVATLKFKTIYQPIEPETASSELLLEDTMLVDADAQIIPHDTSNGEYTILSTSAAIDQYRPLDIQLDVGSIHFGGEIADFYILVTDYGEAIDPENIEAILFFEGTEWLDLTIDIIRVSQGLYRIPYGLPAGTEAGTYALVVKAEYAQVSGTALKSYLVSSTLDNWDTSISNIEENIATVIIPSIGQIKIDLVTLNATLVSIKNGIATVQTSIGTLTTDLENLNAEITKIDGDIATVKTDLGTVETKVTNIETKVSDAPEKLQTSINLLYVTMVLALIAAIFSAIATFRTFRKPSASALQ